LILAQPLVQVGSGVLVGTVMTLVFDIANVFAVLGYGAVMLVVCMVGSAVPAIRALRIQPMEALKTE
jgi:ABC-type antimicrobial peptide transport system permease subunit